MLHREAYEPQMGDAVYYVRALQEHVITLYKSIYLHYEPTEKAEWAIFPWEINNDEPLLQKDNALVLCIIEDINFETLPEVMRWAQCLSNETQIEAFLVITLKIHQTEILFKILWPCGV